MIPEYNRKSLLLGIPGLLIQIGFIFLPRIAVALGADPAARLPQWAVWGMILGPLLGAVLLIIGLCYYAKAKGYSVVLGLLGLFSCIGMLILAVLPDKTKDKTKDKATP